MKKPEVGDKVDLSKANGKFGMENSIQNPDLNEILSRRFGTETSDAQLSIGEAMIEYAEPFRSQIKELEAERDDARKIVKQHDEELTQLRKCAESDVQSIKTERDELGLRAHALQGELHDALKSCNTIKAECDTLKDHLVASRSYKEITMILEKTIESQNKQLATLREQGKQTKDTLQELYNSIGSIRAWAPLMKTSKRDKYAMLTLDRVWNLLTVINPNPPKEGKILTGFELHNANTPSLNPENQPRKEVLELSKMKVSGYDDGQPVFENLNKPHKPK